MISLDIKVLNSAIMKVGVVYRPPDSKSDWMDRFDDHKDGVISTNMNIDFVLNGDFNIDLRKCIKLKTMMEVNGLQQIITQPTRVTLKSESLINHMYVNEKSYFTQSGVVPIGVSDHHLSYTVRKRIKQNKYQHVYITYRHLKHADEHAYL